MSCNCNGKRVPTLASYEAYGEEPVSPPPEANEPGPLKWALVLTGAGVLTHLLNGAIDGAARRRRKRR